MKWSHKNYFEYLCTGSGTNEDLSVLTGLNEIQTIGIFEILICIGGGPVKLSPKKNFEYLFTGSSTNVNLSY